MRDWSKAVGRRLRSLFGGAEAAPSSPGNEALMSGLDALLALEIRVADAIVHPRPPEGSRANAFGRRVVFESGRSARACAGEALGMATAGLRVAAFLPPGEPDAAHGIIAEAAARRVPLVLYYVLSAHEPHHRLADSGALLVLASDAQRAVDAAFAARQIAELALGPVVVAIEAELARSVHRVRLPDVELVRELLGDPDDSIEAPVPGQALLLGERRRRVPRFFDHDQPLASGSIRSAAEAAGGAAASETLFGAAVPELTSRVLTELGARTGRTLETAATHSVVRARHVIVTQGAATGVAASLAQRLGKERLRIGVIGVEWLRPFPTEAVQQALADAEVVTVLERTSGPTPLRAEVESLLRAETRITSALYGPDAELPVRELAALCHAIGAGEAREVVRLGIAALPTRSVFPKREAYLQLVARAVPELDAAAIDPADAIDLRPKGARTLIVHAFADEMPEGWLEKLAAALEPLGKHLRCHVCEPAPGELVARLTVATKAFGDPGDAALADVVVIASPALADPSRLAAARDGATLVLATADATISSNLANAAKERDARVLVAPPAWDRLAEISAIAAGVEGELEGLEPARGGEAPADTGDEGLPLAVRRLGADGPRTAALSHFWGELAEPALAGEGAAPSPDPYFALATSPAASATFHEASAARSHLPVIDAGACTACGLCWASCSDGALGPAALDTAAFLDAAEERASGGRRGQGAAKLRRAHKQIAGRVDSVLADGTVRTLRAEVLRDAYAWAADKLKLSASERPEADAAFDATVREATRIPASVTDALFRLPHRASKGDGALLLLAADPRSCQGCGACATVCPEKAIVMEPATRARVEAMREGWRVWERLPDTSGAALARAAARPDVGLLAAAHLGKSCLFSMTGGDGAEPGSGQRLASRLVGVATEYQVQRQIQGRAEALAATAKSLREACQKELASGVPTEDLEALDTALADLPNRAGNLGPLLERLAGAQQHPGVDAVRMRGLVESARAVERIRWQLTEGPSGVGRARWSAVVAGEIAEWAGRFGRNPFTVPVAVDKSGDGTSLALGLVHGVLSRSVEEARTTRRAALWLEAPDDLPARLRALTDLAWSDLSAEEAASCPPAVLFVRSADLADDSAIPQVLASGLPVKIVLLDERFVSPGPDPILLALALRDAFVLSASIAHGDHLIAGVAAALAHCGPALIHVHAPSPRLHGFAADGTHERARLAVGSRLHPLLRYDPAADGVFGARIDLSGNPSVESHWAEENGGPLTPAHFAASERRFAHLFHEVPAGARAVPIARWCELAAGERAAATPTVPGPEGELGVGPSLARATLDRLGSWRTLQELAGVATPFVAAVRASVESELEDAHAAEVAALRAEHAAQIAALGQTAAAEHAARLRQRLLTLAGYGNGRNPAPPGDGAP